jgi:uncharacterized protein YkwD
MTLDNAGNTLGTARKLNLTSTTQTVTDFLGTSDLNDFYSFSVDSHSFSVGSRSSLNLAIGGLTANADVQIVQDKNLNGIIDASSEVITGSYLTGTANESIKTGLDAGNYFIRVFPGAGANTNYNLSVSAASFSDRVLELTNAERAKVGLTALKLNSQLNQAAQGHSQDMALRDYYSHTGANGSQFSDRISATGYKFTAAAENIAAGYVTPEDVVKGWMDSPGHKANILNANYKDIGIGHYYLANDTGAVNYNNYWTQNFGVSSQQAVIPPDYAGNTLTTARQITVSSTSTNFTDWVGTADTNDYYRFTLNQNSNFNLNLNGLSSNADVQLIQDINGNSQIDANEILGSSILSGSSAESINVPLASGSYFVRIYPGANGLDTNYNLSLSATSLGNSTYTDASPTNNTYYNTLVTRSFFNNGISAYKSQYGNFLMHGSIADYYTNNQFANNNTNTGLFGVYSGLGLSTSPIYKKDDGSFVMEFEGGTLTNRNGIVTTSYNQKASSFALVGQGAPNETELQWKNDYSYWSKDVGNPTSAVRFVAGGWVQEFADSQGKVINILTVKDGQQLTQGGPYRVQGAMLNNYRLTGGYERQSGGLGFATQAEDKPLNGYKHYQSFENGFIGITTDDKVIIKNWQGQLLNNAVPENLQFGLEKTAYTNTETLRITNPWVFDANGATDINRVDFKLKRADGTFLDTADIWSVTPATAWDNRWGQFNYSLNLAGLNLASGNYSLWAQAYDKAGAASNVVEQKFSLTIPNIAPNSLQFGLEKTIYSNTETLRITSPWVFDANGAIDINRVDFKIKRADGTFIDTADIFSTTPATWDNRWGQFNYSLNLAGLNLGTGNYSLWAVAYDKAGTTSNVFEQKFSLTAPNVAPNSLQFGLEKTTYTSTETLRITNGWVYDINGATDINRVDFRIRRADGTLAVDTADIFSVTPNTSDNRWGQFNYSLNLAGLNLGDGNYSLWAVAYDKAGFVSNVIEQKFNFTIPNIAPTALEFGLEKTVYNNTETLRITNGSVLDTNGATDINRVDFKIKRADGTFVDTADVFSVTPHTSNSRWGQFNYSLNLAGLNLGTGNYSLWAVAYDKAGAASNIIEQKFAIQTIINDWFSQNLKDQQIVTLARSLASDLDLSRKDMLDIFESAKDFSMIDSSESSDLNALVKNLSGTPFKIQEPVQWLARKVAEGAFSNISASQFQSNLVDRWFLGKAAPTARFDQKNNDGSITRFDLNYVEVKGNLFGNSGQARIGDIDQGSLGDCAFLAALGATFGRQFSDMGNTFSSVINSMITNNNDNTYTIKFFKNQTAEYVTVDNRLATHYGSLFTSRNNNYPVSPNNPSVPLWMPLVQKAYAQWRESWGNGQTGYSIVGNGADPFETLGYITGRKVTGGYGTNFTFSTLDTALKNGQAIVTARLSQSNDLIIGGHAYSVTNAYVTTNGQQRIVVRNPWGVDGGSRSSGDDRDGFIDLSFDEFRSFMDYGVSIA